MPNIERNHNEIFISINLFFDFLRFEGEQRIGGLAALGARGRLRGCLALCAGRSLPLLSGALL